MVRKLVLAVAAASALMSSNMALALGVGNINLRSALNQPLDAEIELLQVRDLTTNEILPTLASPDEFGRAGIERAYFLTDLTFTPEVRSDGRAVIRVTSSRPVREPFLNFLMEVRWPSGRVLREFTLLLDPPLYQPGPVAASTPPASQQNIARQAPAPAQQPAAQRPQPPAAAPRAQAAAPASAPAESGQLRTSRSDTLWEIALEHRPQGASVHQTMLAIQDLNPQAFLNGNINTMLADQTLTMPDASQARSRNQAEAIDQVAQQTAAWQSGRQTAAAQPAQRQLDARERATAAPAPATASEGDALRLVAGTDEQGTGEAAGAQGEGPLRDALDRTKEQLDSAESEKAELNERLADVQGQLETLQRLLALKDTQLAALQEQLGTEPAPAEPAAPVAPVETAQESAVEPEPTSGAVESDPVQEDEPQPIVMDSELAEQVEGVAPEAAASEPVAAEPVAQPPVEREQPATEAAPAAQPVAAEEDDGIEAMLQRFLQNQTLVLVAGAVALLILLLILMSIARRNARREAELNDSFIASSADDGSHQGSDFNVALAGFDEPADEQSIAQDPVTEADALVAYGKLDEASEVLSAAIDEHPERADLRLKLMEVKALQQDQHGYVEQAEALHAQGGSEPQIAAMNARFPAMAAGLLGATVIINDLEEEAFDIDFEADAVGSQEYTPVADDESLDYDFKTLESESAFEEDKKVESPSSEPNEEEPEFDLDFDLDDGLADELAKPEAPQSSAFNEADFDLDFDPVAPVPAEPLEDAEVAASETSLDDDFDLSLPDDTLAEENLIADFEALNKPADEDELVAPATEEPEAEAIAAEEDFGFSDDDLAGFEQQLSESMAAEQAAETPESVETTETEENGLTDALDPFAADVPTNEAMGESMEDEFDFLSGTDECATKLDLARAYIDMGDEEGARDILAEVVEEGDEQQKQDARDMLGQLD